MLLTDVSKVSDLLGVNPDPATSDSISIALASATSYLSNKIGTSFKRAARLSVFSVRQADLPMSSGFVVLRLGSCFLVKGSPVVIRIATRSEGMVTEQSEIYEGARLIDYELGTVRIPRGAIRYPMSLNVSVQYSSGFVIDTVEPTKYQDVPEDLMQAAAVHAAKTYYANNKVPTSAKYFRGDFKVMEQLALDCFAKYRRPRAATVWPDTDDEVIGIP